jgi:catechol 2,3-dioxygenase-like lactoylglutathione lyase family enzyme
VLLGVQHIALIVSEVERSRRFYRDAVGMRELRRPDTFEFAGAWFGAGAQEVHLIVASETTSAAGWGDPGPSALSGLASHLALEVDDLDAQVQRMRRHSVAVFAGPFERGDGVVQLYVHDPDRHLIEFFARTGADQRDAAVRTAHRPPSG